MDFAIFELRNADRDGFGPFARQLLDFLQFLAELASVLDLGENFFGDFLVAIEKVKQLLADAVHEVGANFGVAKLVLGLGFEYRVLQPDGHRANHALAHIVAFKLFAAIFVDSFKQSFAKGAQVRAAITGVLAVDERIKGLAVTAIAMGKAELERLLRVMKGGIDRLAAVGLQIFHDEVQQAVARLEGLAVVEQLQARVEITVMPQPSFDMFGQKLDFFKNLGIGFEAYERAVGLVGLALLFILELALFERGFDKLAFAKAANPKFLREGIDRFGPDAVQADAELENIIIILGPSIDLGNTIDDFAKRNAAAEVTDPDRLIFDDYLNLFAGAHNELIDGIIDHLFEQDIAAVIVMRTVANPADVHASTQPDVFQ